MSTRVTLPAGRYLIGDLCYQGDVWDEILGGPFDSRGVVAGTTSDGRRFAWISTAYGDGEYGDVNTGQTYFVDSGTIGIIEYAGITGTGMGRTHDFPEPFEVYNDEGLLVFGHVRIQTGTAEDDRDWGMEWHDTSMELA